MFCGSVGIRFGYLQFMSLSVSVPTTTNTNTHPYLLDTPVAVQNILLHTTFYLNTNSRDYVWKYIFAVKYHFTLLC